MKKQMLLLMTLCVSGEAIAQTAERQVIGSSGGSYSGASMQVDYTAGEAVTASGAAGSFSVNQGFQQNPTNGTGIQEKNLLVNFSLYPNPAKNLVTLSLKSAQPFTMRMTLSNVTGQILITDPKSEKVTVTYKREIPLEGYASGIYFLNLLDEKNALLQSIRFVKQ